MISERGLENLERDGWPIVEDVSDADFVAGLDGRALAWLSWSKTAPPDLVRLAEAEVSRRASTMGDRPEAPEFVENLRALIAERPSTAVGFACPKCGSFDRRLGPGSGPHAGREDCAGCGRFLRWVPKGEMRAIDGGKAE